MKGHVIRLADVLTMFPQFTKNGLTKYRFAQGKSSLFLVMVSDVSAIITDYERRVLLSTYTSYFDTELVPVIIGTNKIK